MAKNNDSTTLTAHKSGKELVATGGKKVAKLAESGGKKVAKLAESGGKKVAQLAESGGKRLAATSGKVAKNVRQQSQKLGKKVSTAVSEMSPKQKKVAAVAAAGAGAVAVAGLVAVLRKRRKQDAAAILHLGPHKEGWRLKLEGKSGKGADFDTKEAGLAAARDLARDSAPSELVVHRADGTEQDRHRYEKN